MIANATLRYIAEMPALSAYCCELNIYSYAVELLNFAHLAFTGSQCHQLALCMVVLFHSSL